MSSPSPELNISSGIASSLALLLSNMSSGSYACLVEKLLVVSFLFSSSYSLFGSEGVEGKSESILHVTLFFPSGSVLGDVTPKVRIACFPLPSGSNTSHTWHSISSFNGLFPLEEKTLGYLKVKSLFLIVSNPRIILCFMGITKASISISRF